MAQVAARIIETDTDALVDSLSKDLATTTWTGSGLVSVIWCSPALEARGFGCETDDATGYLVPRSIEENSLARAGATQGQ